MQIDRKPNRWPFVGALIGLLMVCLSLPRYWQSYQKRDDLPPTLANNPADDAVTPWVPVTLVEPPPIDPFAERTGNTFGVLSALDPSVPAGVLPDVAQVSEYLLNQRLQPMPTIDELVSTLGRGYGTTQTDALGIELSDDVAAMYLLVPYARTASPNSVDAGLHAKPLAPSPEIAEALQAFGAWWVTRAPRIPANWLEQAATWYQRWSTDGTVVSGDPPLPANEAAVAADGPVASLQVTSPDDRLAMTPPQTSVGPIEEDELVTATPAPVAIIPQENRNSWTTPKTLLEQLERLTRHPYAARWANDTIWELEAMAGRDHASAYDVTTGLTNLTLDAEQAFELARDAEDDQLRAELLRAHWGLARRLDCWKMMHEIHIASCTSGRLAARGEFKSLFADPPGLVIGKESQPINAAIESYEQSCDPKLGRAVVAAQRDLRASTEPLDQALAETIEQHYRNANIRIAITGAMLNRFVSGERTESRSVRERVAGTPVRGHAETTSDSRVKLLPATGQWHLDLEAEGVVDSVTVADGGAAQVRSRGATEFTASKSITIDPAGVRADATSVRANSDSRPLGVTSDYDWMPIVGDVIRNRAMDQHRAKRGRAKSEVEFKVASRAMKQLDRESGRIIDEMRDQAHDQVFGPLSESGVELTTVELTSSPERLVARLRIAGNKQIGAHTPRPRAPSDSLASLQIHESALTNATVSLGLDNHRFTAEELQARVRDRLPRLATTEPLDARPNTAFQFADQDAVQFHMHQGRLELTVALALYEQEGRRIGPIVVHAFYTPVIEGLDAELARDGGLGIEGRISAGDRAVLHNVFKEIFSEDRRLPVVKLGDPSDQRLAGLMITQLVMEDGWLGIAVGPTTSGRLAERTRSLR